MKDATLALLVKVVDVLVSTGQEFTEYVTVWSGGQKFVGVLVTESEFLSNHRIGHVIDDEFKELKAELKSSESAAGQQLLTNDPDSLPELLFLNVQLKYSTGGSESLSSKRFYVSIRLDRIDAWAIGCV